MFLSAPMRALMDSVRASMPSESMEACAPLMALLMSSRLCCMMARAITRPMASCGMMGRTPPLGLLKAVREPPKKCDAISGSILLFSHMLPKSARDSQSWGTALAMSTKCSILMPLRPGADRRAAVLRAL